ncbi:hypothetical protein [Flavobacterium psychrotolerans]|uniref:Carboxypeptidase-like regulatory domain-containing protein n=1 Tax=Flavobacterium psychrotolerans TaxID=2169410 RepID=A0A2U1JG90_9FLAO|nr:hypothetical protein [Flavobacterium psychrotolerans]PWA04162.1 hypothetical protein DB895_12330 [Flavobacterium psychrotolerans]
MSNIYIFITFLKNKGLWDIKYDKIITYKKSQLKMFKNILFYFFYFVIIQNSFSQTDKLISGTILANNIALKGINIINIVNKSETKSDENGKIKILCKPNDLLVTTSSNFELIRKTIDVSEYNSGEIIIEMTPKANELDEVTILKYSKINAADLGILVKSAKKYTPAERRLYAASGGISGIINSLNGNIKILKKDIEIEKQHNIKDNLTTFFSDDFYINQLKIPKDYIRGFQYFSIEDDDFKQMMLSKEKNLIAFKLEQLAEIYKILQKDTGYKNN